MEDQQWNGKERVSSVSPRYTLYSLMGLKLRADGPGGDSRPLVGEVGNLFLSLMFRIHIFLLHECDEVTYKVFRGAVGLSYLSRITYWYYCKYLVTKNVPIIDALLSPLVSLEKSVGIVLENNIHVE